VRARPGGTALAKRIAKQNRRAPHAADFAWVAAQVADDAATLEGIAGLLSVPVNPVKRRLARIGEWFSRLKANGFVARSSPVSLVLELEMLMAGIDAKRSLWRALAAADLDALRAVDLDRLGRRASQQREILQPHHADAAAAALGAGG
jgi:hypothetical protein